MILIETGIIRLNSAPGLVGHGTSSSYPSVGLTHHRHQILSCSPHLCMLSFLKAIAQDPSFQIFLSLLGCLCPPYSQVCVLREQTFHILGELIVLFLTSHMTIHDLSNFPALWEPSHPLTGSQSSILPSYGRQCQQAQKPVLTVPSGDHSSPTEKRSVNSGTYTHCPGPGLRRGNHGPSHGVM